MKNFLILFLILIITQNCSFCETFTTENLKPFTNDNKYFGLKDDKDNIIVDAVYKKVIRLGTNAWIIQNKKNRFGLINCNGDILVEPKYIHAERYFNKFVKLGNNNDYGLYNDFGKSIIPAKYNEIMPLFGKKFLTYKNFKYGVYSEKGLILLDNKYDFIYMPTPKKMRIKYGNEWYEIDQISEEDSIDIPENNLKLIDDQNIKMSQLFINTGAGAGYSIVSATDYTIKMFSSISNAYEESIDELMLSQGIDTISIFLKMSWIPKFPVIFVKNYWNNISNPTKGPLSEVRAELKEQIK